MNYPVLRHFPLRQSSQSDECPFYVELEDRESDGAFEQDFIFHCIVVWLHICAADAYIWCSAQVVESQGYCSLCLEVVEVSLDVCGSPCSEAPCRHLQA